MTTTLFLFSLVAMGFMVGWKLFETKVRKVHLVSNLFQKGDDTIHMGVAKASLAHKRYKKIANIFVFEFLPSYIYELLIKLKDYVAKEYYKAGDELRGRRILRRNGSVSFFLERLAEKPVIEGRKV